MRNTRIPVAIVLCALLSTSVSCGDDDNGSTGPPDPVPGTLTLSLGTLHVDDGALVLRLQGADITQVALAAPGLYLRFLEDQTGVTAVFVGDVVSGDLLTFHVPDVNSVASYAGTVLEAADRSNALRGSLAEYTLTVAR
ncbi:MAG: hypothetical protein N2B05_09610 [Gemmatimonadales bacterium]